MRRWHARAACRTARTLPGLKKGHEPSEILAGAKGSSYGKKIVILGIEAYETPNDLIINIVAEAFSLDRMRYTKDTRVMLFDDAHAVV